jgi:hypothetical protein
MPRTQTRTLMTPIQPASGGNGDDMWVINPGMLYSPDHELVRAHPELFKEAEAQRPEVETMTKGPGERRGDR